MADMTISIILGDKIKGSHDNTSYGSGKSFIYYRIRYGKNKYYIKTQYRVLPYDFVGKQEKVTRIPLYNELIKEELEKFHELKEKYGNDERIAFNNFRAWMEKRNEI